MCSTNGVGILGHQPGGFGGQSYTKQEELYLSFMSSWVCNYDYFIYMI